MKTQQIALLAVLLAIGAGTLITAGAMIGGRFAPAGAPGSVVATGSSAAAPAPDAGGERLPCGHRLSLAGKSGEVISTAICVHGHLWGYHQGAWDNSTNYAGPTDLTILPPKMPSSEDIAPCGHRVGGSELHDETLTVKCVRNEIFESVNGRWEKR